jgi:hypothetical protein
MAGEAGKSDRRVDDVAEQDVRRADIAVQNGLHRLVTQSGAKRRLGIGASPHGLTKIPGQWHQSVSCSARRFGADGRTG